MGPSSAASRCYLAGIKLTGNRIAAGMASGLNFSNDRQDIGRIAFDLSLPCRLIRFKAYAGLGLPRRVPRALAAANAALVRSEMASFLIVGCECLQRSTRTDLQYSDILNCDENRDSRQARS